MPEYPMRNKSDENWRVGQRCLNDGDLDVATSRLYYGLFQAVLLYAKIKKGYISQGRGVHKDMTNLVFSEGKASTKYGRVFKEFRALRETADYEPDTPTVEEISELLPHCDYMRNFYLKSVGV